MREKLIYIARIVGFLIILVMSVDVAASTVRLMINGSIWGGDIVLTYFFVIGIVVAFYRKKTTYDVIIVAVILFTVILAVGIYGYGFLYGLDWDGNCYHKMAVGFLRSGWNPIKESAESFAPRYFGSNYRYSNYLWLDHYGKASWIFAADIYKLTCNIECGKIYQLLGILGVFFISFSYIYEKTKKIIVSLFISYLLAFNPVSAAQSISYYVDGFLFSMFYMLIWGLIGLIDCDSDKIERWILIFASMILLANIKFTGLLYGGIFCVAVYILTVIDDYKNQKENGWIKISAKRCVLFILLAFMSIVIVGFPTYVKNTVDHGTPTYPLTGSDVDIMTYNSPSGFEGKSGLYKNFYGLFGQIEDVCYSAEKKTLPRLKIPFTFSSREITVRIKEDIRIGGFGIFFSGIYLTTIAMFLFMFVGNKSITNSFKLQVGLIILVCLSLHVGISESWWARYSPYVYMVPICVILAFVQIKPLEKKVCGLIWCLLILMFINNAQFYMRPYTIIKNSKWIRIEGDKIAGKNIDIAINEDFLGKCFDLEDRVVTYHIVDEIDNPDGTFYNEKWKEVTMEIDYE